MVLMHLQSKPLRNGETNPKNYPFVKQLKELLNKKYPGEEIIEITKVIPLEETARLIEEARVIICVDSYLHHFCWYMNKQAIVLWGQSDPKIFGHDTNINLLKDIKYLRKKQFDLWEYTDYNQTKCNNDAFVLPSEIMKHI